jgi:hypothetical protein
MIYFHFLSSHLEVNPAKNDTLELKLANRHSEIQSTPLGLYLGNSLKKTLGTRKTPLKNISNKEKVH